MEFQIGEITYMVAKLDARSQFHIVRRLTPVLGGLVVLAPALGKSYKGIKEKVKRGEKVNVGEILSDDSFIDGAGKGISAMADALSSLSDETADYVLFGLLVAVKRKMPQGTGWASVSTGTQMMFDDIDMATMLRLAWESIAFNLGGFFAALPSDLKEAVQKASAPSAG
jgi:hypothetical protein